MQKYTSSKKEIGISICIAVLLLFIIAMNAVLVFHMTSEQTMNSGELQMGNIKGELQEVLSDSERITLKIASQTELQFSNRNDMDMENLTEFFKSQKRIQKTETNGFCMNVYIAGSDWYIIPDFNAPDGFKPEDRIWYTGALEHPGEIAISPPYLDLASRNVCYTMSTTLSDGKTVVALDFTLSKVQEYIQKMCREGNRDAMIVTADGEILGYTDNSYVGKDMKDVLPEYREILELEKNSVEQITLKKSILGKQQTIFCSRTENGWYLIVSVNDWELYKQNYLQLATTSAVNIGLMIMVIALYLYGIKSRNLAQKALAVKEEFLSHMSTELRVPLSNIISGSNPDIIFNSDNPAEAIDRIKKSGQRLSEMIDDLLSFSGIIAIEKKEKIKKNSPLKISGMNYRIRFLILTILLVTMIVSIVFNMRATWDLGNSDMENEVETYEYELSEWIAEQKSILDMFCSIISTNPDILDDYESAVSYINDITVQYPEISVSYMTNPDAKHTVIMNNGWQPDDDWKVEERQWYIDTEKSKEGWNISSPYYDEQTGFYCVTFSERVYDADSGEFLGNFGIDFFMDKLTEILGESYVEDSYAFLMDSDGNIVNHPYAAYQMSEDNQVNIRDSAYKNIHFSDYETAIFKDYDDQTKICVSKVNNASGFTIVVAKDWWSIYGSMVLYGILLAVIFISCTATIYYLLSHLMKWQEEVQLQLQESADSAIAAGKAKSQFLAQMSHEIRTPINAVLGMNEMILRESENMDIREYAMNIQSAGRTLLSLINSILDFSKIEDGKMEIVPVEYDTASLVNDLVHIVLERAKKKNLEFKLDISKQLPKTLFGDDVRIRQIISNLLSNAVKYTPAGAVTLLMKEEKIDQESILLYVAVTDTGIGIKPEDMEKLFESFQRLDQQRNRNIEGTGLGISIVQKLLQMMDSKLEVESVYGEGSKFFFSVKQKVVSAEPIGDYEKRLQDSILTSENETYLFAPDASILVVDDNEMNLKVIKGLLKRNGIVPDTADSGKKCLELVSGKLYDIIFLDHMMPEMDGIETHRRLRSGHLLNKNTSVIVLTANAIVGARDEYLKEGFDDYLSKPIEVGALEAKLTKHLPKDIVSYKEVNKQQPKAEDDTENDTQQTDTLSLKELRLLYEKCPQLHVLRGLSYCMESKAFYLSMLNEFRSGDKRQSITEAYEKEDTDNYRILVHALKSTSLSIGAQLLSEHAKGLEMAAKADNWDYIHQNHDEVMAEYAELLDGITALQEELEK